MPSTKQRFPNALEHPCTLNGQKPGLKLDRSRLLLAFKRQQTENKVQDLLTKNDLPLTLESPFEDPDTNSQSKSIINHSNKRFWVRTADKKPMSENVQNSLEGKLQAHLAWIAPVYQIPDIPGRRGVVAPVANILLVKPRRQEGVTDPKTLQAVSAELRKMNCNTSPNESATLEPDEYVSYRVKNPNECAIYKLNSKKVATPKGPIDAVQFDYMPLLSTVTWGTL